MSPEELKGATKLDNDVLRNCADDEPIFVLRAKDRSAPFLVRMWADFNREGKATTGNRKISQKKADEAEERALLMERWQAENAGQVKEVVD